MSSVGDEITSVDQIGTMREGMVWVKATNPLWAGNEEANPYKPGIVKSKSGNKLTVMTDVGKITVTLPTPTDEGDFQWKAYKKTSGPATGPGGRRRRTSRRNMRGGASVYVHATWSPELTTKDKTYESVVTALFEHLEKNGVKYPGAADAVPYLSKLTGTIPGTLPSPLPSLPDFSTTVNGKEYTAKLKVSTSYAGGKRKTRGRRRH